jgi:hypothetical protein
MKMMTATVLRRPPMGQRSWSAWAWSVFSAFSAKVAEIYGRKGSSEPKSESWRYFSA